MPEAINLAHAMKMEPKDAVDYFRSKGYRISWNWEDTWAGANAHAFTVAKASTMDVLTDVRRGVDRALAKGMSEGEFVRLMSLRLQTLGWWGKKVSPETPAGGAQLYQAGSFHRLKTIYRTNLQSAYAAGRWKQMLEDSDRRPYLQYIAVLDERTRPRHRALHGRVMRFDDPAWSAIAPVNGFNCRCRLRSLSEERMRIEGLTAQSSEGHLTEHWTTDERTGVSEKTLSLKLPGMERAITPDLGWSYNPGEAAFGTDMKAARSLSAIGDRDIRRQAIQALNGNPWRQEEFARWVDDAFSRRAAGHAAQVLGFTPEDVVEWVAKEKSIEAASVLALPEKKLLHADRPAHVEADIQLTLQEYRSLPETIAAPDAVYWDNEYQTVVFVRSAADGRMIYVPVDPALKVKKRGVLDAAVNAYKVEPERLNNRTRFRRIR